MHVKLSKATEFSVRPEKRISFTVHETKELIQLVWEGQTELINIKEPLQRLCFAKGVVLKVGFVESCGLFGSCKPQGCQQAPCGGQSPGTDRLC